MTSTSVTRERPSREGWATRWQRLVGGVLLGASGGFAWGVLARAWMRLISPRPEFTWSGTLFIVGLTTVVGALIGLAAVARTGRWPHVSQVLGSVTILPLGIGAGAVMLPPIIAGAFALPGPTPRVAARLVLVVLPGLAVVALGFERSGFVAAGVVGLSLITVGVPRVFRSAMALVATISLLLVVPDLFRGALPMWRAVLGAIGYVLLLLPVTVVYARVVRPSSTVDPAPSTAVGGEGMEVPI